MRESSQNQPTHKEIKTQKDEDWDKNRQDNRIHNIELAHGFIHAASGQVYFDHGTSREKKKR